jgi:uncharacterized coiled-coil protein SlyX
VSDDKIAAGGPRVRPVDQAMNRMGALDKRIEELEAGVGEYVGTMAAELDEAFQEVWQTLQLMHLIQGGMMQALKALTEEPGSPHSAASKAQQIITDMEDAYGSPAEGSTDDGVVPDAEGNPPGDS